MLWPPRLFIAACCGITGMRRPLAPHAPTHRAHSLTLTLPLLHSLARPPTRPPTERTNPLTQPLTPLAIPLTHTLASSLFCNQVRVDVPTKLPLHWAVPRIPSPTTPPGVPSAWLAKLGRTTGDVWGACRCMSCYSTLEVQSVVVPFFFKASRVAAGRGCAGWSCWCCWSWLCWMVVLVLAVVLELDGRGGAAGRVGAKCMVVLLT
jgi:hypothetical protein